MADVSMNLKEFNVEFDDTNTSKSANIVSGHDIKESFATIHKRLDNIGYTFGTEATLITSNVDLDNYTQCGIYRCDDSTLTITHSPVVSGFKLYVIDILVKSSPSGGKSAQYYIPDNEDCIYVRYYDYTRDPETWSSWKRLGEQVILSYGNSTWDDFYDAYIHNAVVYCRASSNTNPATGSQTRMAFMAYVNNGADPTEVEFQYYRSVNSHTDSQQGDQVFVYKLIKNSGWSVTTRNAFSKVNVSAPITKSYASQALTIGHADSGVTAGMYDAVSVDAKGHVTSGEVTNLLEFTGMSQTVYDVVVTVGANDVVTASGTSTSDSNSFVFGTITPPKTGHYIIKSNSTAAGTGKWYTQIREGPGAGDTIIARVYNDPVDVELTAGTTYTCRLYFGNGIAVSDSFSVMVYPAGPADSNYVVGAPTNRRLYDTKMEYDKGRQIVNGSDLDDYLTIGTYYCGSVGDSSSGVKSLSHTPFSAEGYGFAAFKLIVEKISSDTVMQQKLIPLYSNGAFFIRRRMTINGTLGWQDWQYFNHDPIYDTSPTQNSSNPVTSDGIYNANAAQQAEIDYAINTGAKNVFSGSFTNDTIRTVEFIWDSNSGTLTANGTATGGVANLSSTNFILKKGTYIFSSSENPNRDVTYDSYIYNVDSSATIARDNSNDSPGTTFTIAQDTVVRVNCRIASEYNAQNVVFKPMIRDSVITNDTFELYAPTNRKLFESIQDNDNIIYGYVSDNSSYIKTVTTTGANATKTVREGTLAIVTFKQDNSVIADDIYDGIFLNINGTSGSITEIGHDAFLYDANATQDPIGQSLYNSPYVQFLSRYGRCGYTNIYMYKKDTTNQFNWVYLGSSYDAFGTSLIAQYLTYGTAAAIGGTKFFPLVMATCSSSASSQNKVATTTTAWGRLQGCIVAVKYSNTNTYDANNATAGTGSITLNVNGTGAANIYYGSTANPTGTNTAAFGYANRYAYYMWDGTYWVWLSQGTDNNTTYSSMTATEIRAGTATTGRLITPANLNLANYGLGTALKAYDDLNSTSVIPVTRGNRYYGSSTQICKSIKHRPDYANSSSVIFMIETKITTSVTSGSEKMIMIMYACNTTTNDTNIYYRSYGGTWGSWKQVTDSTISDYVPS